MLAILTKFNVSLVINNHHFLRINLVEVRDQFINKLSFVELDYIVISCHASRRGL